MTTRAANKFCALSTLRNESDVEQFLVTPLLADLGYGSDYIETKTTVPEVKIGKGKNRRSYAPDYLTYTDRRHTKPVLVIDAKHPAELAEEGVLDAQLYASVIRRKMATPKPDQFCIGVNGNRLIVKHYDSDDVFHSMSFSDFIDGNPKLEALRKYLARTTLAVSSSKRVSPNFEFRSVAPIELPAIFESCHRAIWKAEKRSPASAFYEFAKVMFVKITEDRRLHEYMAEHDIDASSDMVPRDAVRFSGNVSLDVPIHNH